MINPYETIRQTIESEPEKYGIFGTERVKFQAQIENLGLDTDHINGFDDGEGPQNYETN
jgi:hypothetical protein